MSGGCRHLDLESHDQGVVDKMLELDVTRGSRDHSTTPGRGEMLPEARGGALRRAARSPAAE